MNRKGFTEPNVRAYKFIKDYCHANGLTKENLSMMTLLLPPGSVLRDHELMMLVERLLYKVEAKYIICIEPVLNNKDLYRKAGFNDYKDDLPWFHAHVLIEDQRLDMVSLRREWNLIVNSSNKKLFLCTPLESSLCTAMNYVVKFLEKQREGEMIFKFDNHSNDHKPEITDQAEAPKMKSVDGEEQNDKTYRGKSFTISIAAFLIKVFEQITMRKMLFQLWINNIVSQMIKLE